MQPAWKTVVGAPCAACNAAAWAFHRGSLVDASSPGGTMVSLAGDEGTVQWASPVADGTHYQSASLAGGVAIASGMVIVATGNDVVAYAPTGLT